MIITKQEQLEELIVDDAVVINGDLVIRCNIKLPVSTFIHGNLIIEASVNPIHFASPIFCKRILKF